MTINWLAVIVATVASWALGAAWYMVFAKQWLAAIGKTRDQIDAKDFTPYIFSVVVQLIMAIVLSLVIAPLFGSKTIVTGLQAGALMWLGFVDGGYMLAVLLVQGIVIGLFG